MWLEMCSMVILNREWHLPGAQNECYAGEGQWHHNKADWFAGLCCNCSWLELNSDQWSPRACPPPLVDRVENTGYWITETAWAEKVSRFLFMGLWLHDQRGTHFLTISYGSRRRERGRGWFTSVRNWWPLNSVQISAIGVVSLTAWGKDYQWPLPESHERGQINPSTILPKATLQSLPTLSLFIQPLSSYSRTLTRGKG